MHKFIASFRGKVNTYSEGEIINNSY